MSAGRLTRLEVTSLPQITGRLARAELTAPVAAPPAPATSTGRLARVDLAATVAPTTTTGRLARAELTSTSAAATTTGRLARAQLTTTATVVTVRGRLSRSELTTVTPLLVSAGPNVAAIEPWSVITLTGTEAGAVPDSRAWRRVSGAAVTLSSPTTATTTYEAPGALAGATVTFGYTASVGGTTSTEATVTHTVLPVTERAVVGGVEVPLRLQAVAP